MSSDKFSDEYQLSSPEGAMKVDSAFNVFNYSGSGEANPKPTWEELQQLEFLRREILQRVEHPFWRILAYWNGTALKALVSDILTWIPISIFVAIRIQARMGGEAVPAIAEAVHETDIDILGGFLSFLLVLFVNQTNNRFFEMYQLSKKCAGKIQDVAGLVCTQFPPPDAHRIIRYMNAAHVSGYVGLGGPYTQQHFFDHFNREHTLLTDSEMTMRLQNSNMDSGSATFKELVTWCQHEVGRAHKRGIVDSYEASRLQALVLDLRAAMDGMYDYCDQPVHFFYIHFLCMLSALYLPLFAVDNAFSSGWGENSEWSIELLNGTIVLLQSIFVVGLRLLGQKMIDPFGKDLEDLSVITYITTTIENCRIILTAEDANAGEFHS